MTIPLLPTTRPTADNFGPDLVDDRPVEDPTTELSAVAWNQVRYELAQVASTVPRAVVRITNNGTAAVATALGVTVGSVSVLRTGTGIVGVTFSPSLLVSAVSAMSHTSTASIGYVSFTPGSNVVQVNSSATGGDCDFTLWVW